MSSMSLSMDARTDTLSSGRFGGQWAFLSNPPPPQHDQTRSLPPSSYIRSDRSTLSPLPTGLHSQQLNASRSSLPRHIYTSSVGGLSSSTNPPQPVLIRVHSANASHHLRPSSDASHRFHTLPRHRPPRSHRIMADNNRLPPLSDYGFAGILGAIEEDVEEDVNAISEILGRSRLALADQHESHLPPQGEIRATGLQAVAEASSSNERLAADNVVIMNEDASLFSGSNAGSRAYTLLGRLQARPHTRRRSSEVTRPRPPSSGRVPVAPRNNSSPAVLTEAAAGTEEWQAPPPAEPHRTSRDLLQLGLYESTATPNRATPAIVSEVYLSAGADGKVMSDPPVVSEAGRHYPLYSYDESDLFEHSGSGQPQKGASFRERVQRLLMLGDVQGMILGSTKYGARRAYPESNSESGAESHLRQLLARQSSAAASTATGQRPSAHLASAASNDELYD